MRMSIWGTLACLLLLVAGDADAQAVATIDAMAQYRAMTTVVPRPCTRDIDPETITVCAIRLREAQKLPYPQELDIGRREGLLLGEMPRFGAGAPCPPRGCACPPSECGLRVIFRKLFKGE